MWDRGGVFALRCLAASCRAVSLPQELLDSTSATGDFGSVLLLLERVWIPLPLFLTAASEDPSV